MTTQRPSFVLRLPVTKPWYRWVVFTVANLAFTSAFMFVGMGLIAPEIMRDFRIEASQVGLLISVYAYAYALMQIPAGVLADRVGPRRVMSLFQAMGAMGMLLFSQAPDFGVGLAGRLLTAAGVSVLYVNQLKVLRGWFRADQFATALGIGSSVSSVASLLATPVLAGAVVRFGWRPTFAAGGLINLASALACWAFVRDRDPSVIVEPESAAQQAAAPPVAQAVRACLGNRQFLYLFFLTLMAYGGLMGIYGGWGLPFLMQGYGMSKMNAALLMMGASVFSLLSAPLWGYLSDKRLHARRPVLLMGLVGASLSMLPLATMAARMNVVALGFILSLLGFSTSALLLSYTMVNELVPVAVAGVATAILNMGPYLGSGVFQSVTGFIMGSATSHAADGTPIYTVAAYQRAFVPSLVAGVAATLLALLVRETMKSKQG